MNCLEVRRILSSEPASHHRELAAHLDHCAACSRHAVQVEAFEQQLAATFDIEVPENLEYRILLAQSLGHSQHRHQYFRRMSMVAASLFLAITLTGLFYYIDVERTVEAVALKHVNDELQHLQDHKNIQLSTLNNVLQPLSIKLDKNIGTINYAGTCQIRNTKGVHVVLQGEHAPVTLLVMPGTFIDHKKNIADERFRGVLIPVENGSVAIIGETGENLKPLEKRLLQALKII